MIDIIKKTLLAGVGATVITRDKVEAALGELVQQGKVSAAEARQAADQIAAQGRREFEGLSHELGEQLRAKFAGEQHGLRERLDALEARVAALERAGAGASAPSAGPT